jgi:hypothetical protein
MPVFPRLRTGAVTQYPSSRRTKYVTQVTHFIDGKEQRFRELRNTVRLWLISLNRVSPHEASAVESFFLSMQGQFESFTFVDPWDGVEYEDCSFEEAELTTIASSESTNQAYLVIRNNAL